MRKFIQILVTVCFFSVPVLASSAEIASSSIVKGSFSDNKNNALVHAKKDIKNVKRKKAKSVKQSNFNVVCAFGTIGNGDGVWYYCCWSDGTCTFNYYLYN